MTNLGGLDGLLPQDHAVALHGVGDHLIDGADHDDFLSKNFVNFLASKLGFNECFWKVS